MKKIILSVFVLSLLFTWTVNAQTEKGNFLFGVSSTINTGGDLGSQLLGLGFGSTKYGEDSDPYKYTAFNFLPRAGFFAIDNLAFGLDIIVGIWSEKGDNDEKYSSSTLAAGPFVRYYYPFSDKIYGIGEFSTAFGICNELDDYGTSEFEEKYGLWTIGGGAGAAFFLCPCISLDMLAGYSRTVWNEKDVEYEYKETSGAFGIRIGVSIYLGLTK